MDGKEGDEIMRNISRVPALAAGLALLTGLGAVSAHAAVQTRGFRQAFPAGAEVRLANLAGRVEIVRGQGNQVVVDATVHAEGRNAAETKQLLQGMKWVRGHDKEGRDEWALSYPVDKHRSYHYPRENPGEDDDIPAFLSFLEGVNQTTTTYRGERVKIYSKKRSSAPTLYTNLKITLPAGGNLAMRNSVGRLRAGNLEGTVGLRTGSGDVDVAAVSGQLRVETGSGDVVVGSAKGETHVGTGSGDVTVRRLVGNGVMKTGSGDVVVEQVSAGKLTVSTGSGDVTVREGEAGTVVAGTGSGGVRILGLDLEDLTAETGSGDVVVRSPLGKARRVLASTGSGDVDIQAGPNASFDLKASQGSGDLSVGYSDAVLRKAKRGEKVVGAKRGDGRTVITVETGSGDCSISPRS
jgi:Putative adhesin